MPSIRHELTFEVPRSTSAVFNYLADVSRTPEWLSRCASLTPRDPGPLRSGSQLDYTPREEGPGERLQATALVVEPGRKLVFEYRDKVFKVVLGFELEPTAAGTRVRHFIDLEVAPLTLSMLEPVIRSATEQQTAQDIASLRARLMAAVGG